MWLPDVTGPDGIRVTLRLEPAVARLDRAGWKLGTTPWAMVLSTRLRRTVNRAVQDNVLEGRWVVDVESDSGVKARVPASDEAEAAQIGERIRAEVAERGESAIDSYG